MIDAWIDILICSVLAVNPSSVRSILLININLIPNNKRNYASSH
jgi:hypothetical protein